jgi:hypothetical protein
MENRSRCAFWIGALILSLLAVDPCFGQKGKPRLRTVTASKVGAINFTRVANSPAVAPSDALVARKDTGLELRHRSMVDALAADRLKRLATKAPVAPPPTLPHVQGLPISENNQFRRAFAGITNFSQANSNFGFSVEPPDQGLAVGNGFVLEAVNDAVAVYSDGGQLLAGVAAINPFFGQLPENDPNAVFLSDPRCLYDAATNRWFVTVLEYNFDSMGNLILSQLLIAVSDSGDPTGGYALFALDIINDGSDFFPGDCPCLGDQPLIGANADGFYISANAFGFLSFQGSQLYLISKAQLEQSAASINVAHVDQLSAILPDIEFSFSIQPSFSPPGESGEKGTEYFVQAMRANLLEQRLAVYAVGNTGALNSKVFDPGQLTLNLAVLPSQTYGAPVPATQRGGPTPLAETVYNLLGISANEQNLDGNDQRMQQVMLTGGKLWTSLGTALASPTLNEGEGDSEHLGSPIRDGVAWFVIDVNNSTGLKAGISRQGYVAGPDNSHLLYPALGVNAKGGAVIGFTLTGPGQFPSTAYWAFGESIHVVGRGVLPEDGFSAYLLARPRWGDYSAAAVTPDGAIWIATETIPGGPRKQLANWGTFLARVDPFGDRDD